jgi:hypothetical protein
MKGGDLMSENRDQKRIEPEQGEKRGLVTDVVVPIAQSGVSGAVGAAVANKLGGRKQPPATPPKKDD